MVVAVLATGCAIGIVSPVVTGTVAAPGVATTADEVSLNTGVPKDGSRSGSFSLLQDWVLIAMATASRAGNNLFMAVILFILSNRFFMWGSKIIKCYRITNCLAITIQPAGKWKKLKVPFFGCFAKDLFFFFRKEMVSFQVDFV